MSDQTMHLISNRSQRRLSPTTQRSGSLWQTLVAQVKAEFLQNLRIPEYLIGIVAIPAMLFLMFGLPNASQKLPEGTTVGALMMASFSAYGILSLAIFTFGVDIANERGKGWLRLMRASPMPAWVYFAGKFAMSILFASIVLLVVFAAAFLLAGVRLESVAWIRLFFILLTGGLAFSTLGFALAYWTRPRAASAIANLVYLPLSFVSGFFFPLNGLPEVLRNLAPYLPTYHYGQLVWGAVGSPKDVGLFTGITPGAPLEHAVWLVGCFVFFGVLAVWGYQRDKGQERV